jgi:NAD(P) transhydrogenase subunit alpha
MLTVFVPKEQAKGETRVAAIPETIKKLVKEGLAVRAESDAGLASSITNAMLEEAGAAIVPAGGEAAAWAESDVVLKVAPPTAEEAGRLKEGALLVGFVSPHANLDVVKVLMERKVSTLAMELVPRISRAQSMDALSSQASIAGYKAVLVAAASLDKYFPLLMTAAGTVKPARIVVMGAGVAGLQAVATAKRLGAIVEVSDIRGAVKEQVESLGGKFIDLPMNESGDGAGGYAKEVTPEFLKKQQAIVAEHIKNADVVITTAAVPGRPAPKLVTEDMVKSMREGAVIVDLAVATGGNCVLSKPDEDVVAHGVRIIGHSNLAATVPADASMLYSRNVLTLMKLLIADSALKLDLEDEIVAGALLTHEGACRHERTASALQGGS